MDEIERRLDEARLHAVPAAAATLADFRADPVLRDAEHAAFERVDAVVTAHADVARHWRERGIRVEHLPWRMPDARPREARLDNAVPLVVLAASALARKGAYELAAALRGLRCRLRVLGSPLSDASLWQGIDVEHAGYAGDWIERASVVVLPAHVEHAPRALLRALAAGIPVVATPACGIDALPGLRLVPAGDVGALRSAIRAVIDGGA
jgi:glycosyltransferase involved in cell wall biosynthesis